MTMNAGIVGWPVTHSLSPVLHGYWLKEHGIDGEMLRLPASSEEFGAVIARARAEGFKGVNVTVPHWMLPPRWRARRTFWYFMTAPLKGATPTVMA